ncbi:MAG: hypothetical protein DMF78_09015, partial [Acidobacteria bacterium]
MARPDAAVYVAVLVAAVAAPAAAGERAPKLDLVWVDPTRMAPGAFSTVKAESSFLLGGLGADVTWTQALDGAVLGPESMAVIVVPTHHFAGGEPRHVMGATRPDTSLPPAVWVYPDEVAWALGFDPRARVSWGSGQRIAFALALARVVSHEIVHALGVPSHAAHGLMAASLDRRALTAPTIVIDAATVAEG